MRLWTHGNLQLTYVIAVMGQTRFRAQKSGSASRGSAGHGAAKRQALERLLRSARGSRGCGAPQAPISSRENVQWPRFRPRDALQTGRTQERVNCFFEASSRERFSAKAAQLDCPGPLWTSAALVANPVIHNHQLSCRCFFDTRTNR